MKLMTLLLLFAFLVSSCAPAATVIPTSTPTETLTPLPTITQTPSPTATVTSTPTPIGGGSEKFIFEYYKAAYEKSFPDLKGDIHVFTSNLDGTNLIPVTNGLKDFNHIENISADGQMALISSHPNHPAKGDLYLIHLNSQDSNPMKLASGLAWSGWPQAIFLDNTHMVYIGQGREGYGFYTVNIDGTNPTKLGSPEAKYAGIVSLDKTRIYYAGINKENFRDSSGVLYAYGDAVSLWWINLDGSGQGKLESNGHQIFPTSMGEGAAFSPDGTSIAWIPADLEPGCSYLSSGFWTPAIRDGTYTKIAGRVSPVLNKNSPHFGKEIDAVYVEDYVRSCFILHVAPLSNMDKDSEIPLIPPFDPTKDDFLYHNDYVLRWWPDSSKILAYDAGFVTYDATGRFPITLYEVAPKDTNAKLVLLKLLSNGSVTQPGPGGGRRFMDSFYSFKFSPDGRQLLFAKYNYGNEGSMINVLNLETMNYIDDFGHNITPDLQIQRVGNIYWLP